jgi:hypothetical protein
MECLMAGMRAEMKSHQEKMVAKMNSTKKNGGQMKTERRGDCQQLTCRHYRSISHV